MNRNGRYYFYVTAADQIGVGVADVPHGPFRDPLGKPLIARGESGTRVMDPAIFVDDDGQAYLYSGQNAARVVKLKADMVTRDGEIVEIPLRNFHEGLWMHKRNGIYYLVYAHMGRAGRPTSIGYATSRAPVGPYRYGGVIVDNDHSDPGAWNNHGSIAEWNGRWYVFYHRSTQTAKVMDLVEIVASSIR